MREDHIFTVFKTLEGNQVQPFQTSISVRYKVSLFAYFCFLKEFSNNLYLKNFATCSFSLNKLKSVFYSKYKVKSRKNELRDPGIRDSSKKSEEENSQDTRPGQRQSIPRERAEGI